MAGVVRAGHSGREGQRAGVSSGGDTGRMVYPASICSMREHESYSMMKLRRSCGAIDGRQEDRTMNTSTPVMTKSH